MLSYDSVGDIFPQIREIAFKDFSFLDEEAVPISVSKPTPLRALKPTSTIIVTGYIPPKANRFSINLTCKAPGNIALHLNPRLDRGYVVRNTRIRNSWEDEETCSPARPSGCAFRRNSYVHLTIFCTTNAFQIAVNGEHFCAFSYRLPLEEVTGLEVNGSFEDVRCRQLELFVYPDPNVCRPSRNCVLSIDRPIAESLNVPVTMDLDSKIEPGTRLLIAGRLKLLPHSFYVNLQMGKTIYPHPVIALHLNPRFLYGSSVPYVVMNCWIAGSWSSEERHQGHLSWMPGREFLLTIRCDQEAYSIWLADKMVGEFRHRMEPSIVDTVQISGDVVLYQVSMSNA